MWIKMWLGLEGPGACTTNHFISVIVAVAQYNKLVFTTSIHFHPSLILGVMAGACQSAAPFGIPL